MARARRGGPRDDDDDDTHNLHTIKLMTAFELWSSVGGVGCITMTRGGGEV